MTTTRHFRRSRVHLVLLGLTGLILLYAALDILAGQTIDSVGQEVLGQEEDVAAGSYRFSSPPATDDAGNLTTRGQTQRRLDLVWGSVFIVAGLGLVVVSIKGLIDRRSVAEVTDGGLRLRVLGPNRYQLFPWADIKEIRAAQEPGNGGRTRPVLLIAVDHPEWYPHDLWGAMWTENWLRVDADQWVEPVEEFVVRAHLELDKVDRAIETNPSG